jgi:hypothetical protein
VLSGVGTLGDTVYRADYGRRPAVVPDRPAIEKPPDANTHGECGSTHHGDTIFATHLGAACLFALPERSLRGFGKTTLHLVQAITGRSRKLLRWAHEAENGQLCGAFEVLHGPDCQVRTVFHFQFAKNPVQIFLNCAFGQMQLGRNFFIQFGLADQLRNLFLTE